MSEIISSFRSKLDIQGVREKFPEISDSETPLWHGSPALMSMSGKYALAVGDIEKFGLASIPKLLLTVRKLKKVFWAESNCR